jgi:hypothetical protein
MATFFWHLPNKLLFDGVLIIAHILIYDGNVDFLFFSVIASKNFTIASLLSVNDHEAAKIPLCPHEWAWKMEWMGTLHSKRVGGGVCLVPTPKNQLIPHLDAFAFTRLFKHLTGTLHLVISYHPTPFHHDF